MHYTVDLQEFKHFLNEKTQTPLYYPESDGMVEWFNRTLCTILSVFVDENHKNWDKQFPFVMMAYQAAENDKMHTCL